MFKKKIVTFLFKKVGDTYVIEEKKEKPTPEDLKELKGKVYSLHKRKKVVFLLEDGDDFIPVKVESTGKTELGDTERELRNWKNKALEELEINYSEQAFIDKYGDLINLGILSGLLIVVLYITYGYLTDNAVLVTDAVEAIKEAVSSLRYVASEGAVMAW